MDADRQDPVVAIERALLQLRHSRPGPRGPHGAPPWHAARAEHVDGPAHLERMPTVRGYRGPMRGGLGGAARFRLLAALREGDGRSVSDLAQAVGVDQPRASRLVNEAVDRGFATREPDSRDARRSVVNLTDAGRDELDRVHEHRRSAVTEALEGFTPEETATLADLLSRFTANFTSR
ncbi:MAG TPA: MarR family winged helix-turn-helix transcriptional regulator [Rhodoglobus sp.]|nr:MarR family winged helix-turn-helix transcriptional regulator [Rhodoglobus sp.]